MHKQDVSRSCKQLCKESSGPSGDLENKQTYCCETDLCNGASKPLSRLPVAVAFLVIIVIVARL